MGHIVQAPIAVPANGGGFVAINASTYSRAVEIAEDVASGATAQGLTVKWPNGNAVDYQPGEVIKIANPGGGGGVLIGQPGNASSFPGGTAVPATVYCSITSRTATATHVRVTEDN